MHKNYFATAAVLGGTAVVLGAFGAHALEGITTDEKILHVYQTGVQYQMYHALAILATALLYARFPHRWIRWAANCFITGTLLFCGSLYLITFLKVQGSTAIHFVGPVTPLGGLFFIAGWLLLLMGVTRKQNLQR